MFSSRPDDQRLLKQQMRTMDIRFGQTVFGTVFAGGVWHRGASTAEGHGRAELLEFEDGTGCLNLRTTFVGAVLYARRPGSGSAP